MLVLWVRASPEASGRTSPELPNACAVGVFVVDISAQLCVYEQDTRAVGGNYNFRKFFFNSSVIYQILVILTSDSRGVVSNSII
jgi:hypothetical protein